MGWGSNASGDIYPCPYCREPMVDDRDSGPTTHMLVCKKRPWRWLRNLFARDQ
jgi:hypothetical protein